MRKKLSADALDLLTAATITGWPMHANDLAAVSELVAAGHLVAEEDGIAIMLSPTTAGVRAALNAKVVAQDGTKFRLADGVEIKRGYTQPRRSHAAPLRVVEPAKPDPFKEGMDAAIAGKPRATDHPEYTQLQADDWGAGFDAGLTVKNQGIG